MAFGRKKQRKEPSKKLTKHGKRGADKVEGVEKRCRAGSCAYSEVMEASRFRAEATQGTGACSSATWHCRSALYDSFELESFSHKLGRSLAQERLRSDAASSSWQTFGRRSYRAPPVWHSRRHAGTVISCFPSCFPKRTPTIQLGKRKGPSLHGAFHVVAKLARRGCHVIARIPTCTVARIGGQVQTHHHYHHHVHQVTHERAIEGHNNHGNNVHTPLEPKQFVGPPPLFHLDEPTFDLTPHSLNAYLPLHEMEMSHPTPSIKYQP
ncbi:hypothetical protein GOP47_0027969 [Adiantum capillus-veneris]|nr:hypothetical protein GOP47_0027969 [Adiantum capillus-veneris]